MTWAGQEKHPLAAFLRLSPAERDRVLHEAIGLSGPAPLYSQTESGLLDLVGMLWDRGFNHQELVCLAALMVLQETEPCFACAGRGGSGGLVDHRDQNTGEVSGGPGWCRCSACDGRRWQPTGTSAKAAEWREAGRRMRDQREAARISPGQQARAWGISTSELSAMERGYREPIPQPVDSVREARP